MTTRAHTGWIFRSWSVGSAIFDSAFSSRMFTVRFIQTRADLPSDSKCLLYFPVGRVPSVPFAVSRAPSSSFILFSPLLGVYLPRMHGMKYERRERWRNPGGARSRGWIVSPRGSLPKLLSSLSFLSARVQPRSKLEKVARRWIFSACRSFSIVLSHHRYFSRSRRAIAPLGHPASLARTPVGDVLRIIWVIRSTACHCLRLLLPRLLFLLFQGWMRFPCSKVQSFWLLGVKRFSSSHAVMRVECRKLNGGRKCELLAKTKRRVDEADGIRSR